MQYLLDLPHEMRRRRRASILFAWKRGFWTRTGVIAAIAPGGACFTPLREESTDGSKFLDLNSSLGFPSSTCFVINNIALKKLLYKKWNSARLRCGRQGTRRGHRPE
jgi:hypothetical protein